MRPRSAADHWWARTQAQGGSAPPALRRLRLYLRRGPCFVGCAAGAARLARPRLRPRATSRPLAHQVRRLAPPRAWAHVDCAGVGESIFEAVRGYRAAFEGKSRLGAAASVLPRATSHRPRSLRVRRHSESTEMPLPGL